MTESRKQKPGNQTSPAKTDDVDDKDAVPAGRLKVPDTTVNDTRRILEGLNFW